LCCDFVFLYEESLAEEVFEEKEESTEEGDYDESCSFLSASLDSYEVPYAYWKAKNSKNK
jgi:hypothetical protein